MRYVEGETLARMLERRGRLSLEETMAILRPVAGALDYVHRRHVIHRDVKPANVIIAADGRVMLTDFDVAKLDQPEAEDRPVAGAPYYMSGEEIRGQPLTQAVDQYSVGIIAYQMLAGHVPCEADSVVGVLRKHCSEPPVPLETLRPGLPPAVDARGSEDREKVTSATRVNARARSDASSSPTPLSISSSRHCRQPSSLNPSGASGSSPHQGFRGFSQTRIPLRVKAG